MRRATLLAVALLLALGGTVQAAQRVPMATGGYAYEFGEGTSVVQLNARAGDPASGWIEFANAFDSWSGPATCVMVLGHDAWVAGRITTGAPVIDGVTYDGWGVRVHDGGTPGTAGDTAITFLDTPEFMTEYCETAMPDFDEWMVPVTAGNLVIHAAR